MKKLLTSCFGLGYLPLAPGTWGSIPPLIIFAILAYLDQTSATTALIMTVLVLFGSIICLTLSGAIIARTGREDPSEIVADEVAGQALTFAIAAGAAGAGSFAAAVVGFVLFRLFDILKPWPIRKLEKLQGGWGILADDLLAGLYAAAILIILQKISLLTSISDLFASSDGTMNVYSAAVLGLVQGLTEFLPVSSSGHLVLFEKIFNFDPEKAEMLLFDLATHVGTLAAILVVFRGSIAAFLQNLSKYDSYGTNPLRIYKRCPAVHLLSLALLATAVTGVLGILLKSYFTSARGSLQTVAVMWLVTATLLLITDRRKKTRLGLRQFGILAAVIVGIAQAAAIMPGISRSGATICAAILLGLHRRWAVEFSFMIAIPAILGAALIQLLHDYPKITAENASIASVATGMITAALVGIIALKILIKLSRTANLKFFAFYCYILGAAVLVYLLC